MTELSASGATASLVVKMELTNYSTTLDKSFKKPLIKKFHKTDLPKKVENFIQNTILKSSTTKSQIEKYPLNFKK